MTEQQDMKAQPRIDRETRRLASRERGVERSDNDGGNCPPTVDKAGLEGSESLLASQIERLRTAGEPGRTQGDLHGSGNAVWEEVFHLLASMESGTGQDEHKRLNVLLRRIQRESDPHLNARAGAGAGSELAQCDPSSTDAAETLAASVATLLHALAQPINTAGCYAVGARNLMLKQGADQARVVEALLGIGQQIQEAGEVMDQLRLLVRGASKTPQP